MLHRRQRYALEILLRKLKFAPVVLIQGARQTGKSFLVKHLIPGQISKVYRTLDLASAKTFALSNPDSFVRDIEKGQLLIIDEAQKVPDVFDSVKAVVDDLRRPGQFILLGSTEFSKLTQVRESLTGRASRLRLFPMTLSEVRHLPMNKSFLNQNPRVSRQELLKYLRNGGMPGLLGIKDEGEKEQAIQDWIELTVLRDANNFKGVKIDPEALMKILAGIARLEDTSAGSIARFLKMDLRKVKTHLQVLKTLFVVNTLEPFPSSSGKTQHYLCDVGLIGHFESSFKKKLETWIIQEFIALNSYLFRGKKDLSFFRSSKGSKIHLILSKNQKIDLCLKLFPEEKVTSRDLEQLRAFHKNNPGFFSEDSLLIALTGTLLTYRDGSVKVMPWESVV